LPGLSGYEVLLILQLSSVDLDLLEEAIMLVAESLEDTTFNETRENAK